MCMCVCRRKAVLIAPGQDRLPIATSNSTSVAMTNKKQNPMKAEGSVATATFRNNKCGRDGGREEGRERSGRKEKTG